MRKFVALFVILFAIHSLIWWAGAGVARERAAVMARDLTAQYQCDLEYDNISVRGYPFMYRVQFTQPKCSLGGDAAAQVALDGDILIGTDLFGGHWWAEIAGKARGPEDERHQVIAGTLLTEFEVKSSWKPIFLTDPQDFQLDDVGDALERFKSISWTVDDLEYRDEIEESSWGAKQFISRLTRSAAGSQRDRWEFTAAASNPWLDYRPEPESSSFDQAVVPVLVDTMKEIGEEDTQLSFLFALEGPNWDAIQPWLNSPLLQFLQDKPLSIAAEVKSDINIANTLHSKSQADYALSNHPGQRVRLDFDATSSSHATPRAAEIAKRCIDRLGAAVEPLTPVNEEDTQLYKILTLGQSDIHAIIDHFVHFANLSYFYKGSIEGGLEEGPGVAANWTLTEGGVQVVESSITVSGSGYAPGLEPAGFAARGELKVRCTKLDSILGDISAAMESWYRLMRLVGPEGDQSAPMSRADIERNLRNLSVLSDDPEASIDDFTYTIRWQGGRVWVGSRTLEEFEKEMTVLKDLLDAA